ncbi:SRPBCC family protein [Streptomyces sp. LMG1-1-1.1]|uniref:SRPBCC family protein n=1 Tax=Streptomyces sp. LMG1-1-1.1 TaxID=3135245 RepID=UPI003466C9FC
MSKVEQTIDVDVPVRSAYDQWTQFEDFPRFMEGVEEVRQLDDRHCHWQTKVAGVRREFDTEIVDQLPDERIAWRSTGEGIRQKGVVSFQSLDADHTRVRLAMDVEPDGMAEKAANALGMLDRRVKGDLKRFKGFIEDHEQATGGWRGRIRPQDADVPTSTGVPMGEEPGPMGDETVDPMGGEGPGPMREEPGSTGDPDRTRRSPGMESWPLPPGPGDPGTR